MEKPKITIIDKPKEIKIKEIKMLPAVRTGSRGRLNGEVLNSIYGHPKERFERKMKLHDIINDEKKDMRSKELAIKDVELMLAHTDKTFEQQERASFLKVAKLGWYIFVAIAIGLLVSTITIQHPSQIMDLLIGITSGTWAVVIGLLIGMFAKFGITPKKITKEGK